MTTAIDPTLASPISQPPSSTHAWFVCLIAALFCFYEFIQMGLPSTISMDLARTFDISAGRLGHLSAFYFYADVLFLLPTGLLLDRYSTRAVVLVGMIICTGGTFWLALAPDLASAEWARFLTGIGNAFAFLSCLRLCSNWFPAEKQAWASAWVITIGISGGAVAQTPYALLCDHLGWRHATLVNGGLGVVILMLIFFVVYDQPKAKRAARRGVDADADAKAESGMHHSSTALSDSDTALAPKQHSVGHSVLLSLKNRQNWLAGLYISFLNLAIFIFGDLWGGLYLRQVDGLTKTMAANVTLQIFIGTVVGMPVWGYVSDRIGLRRLPMLIAAVLSLIVLWWLTYTQINSYPLLVLLTFLLGFFTSAQVIGYPVINESNPNLIRSTALGFSSILIMGGGAVFQPLIGVLMNRHWHHIFSHGQPIYSVSDYHFAFSIMPLAYALAILAALLLKETHCHPYER